MQYFLHDWCHKVALNYMMNFCFLLLMLFGFYWIRLLFYIYCECYFRKLSKFEKSKKNMMPANNWHCDAHFANNLYSLGILVSNWAKIEWEFVLNVEKKKKDDIVMAMRIVELVIVWENLKLLSLIMRFWCFILFAWYLNNTKYIENPCHVNHKILGLHLENEFSMEFQIHTMFQLCGRKAIV